jgi:hypothetical protein
MDDNDRNGLDETAPGPDFSIPENQGGYPLRPPEEDPRWAVRTVKIWFGVALAFLAFILTLMLLGVFYD